jgi:hypothetical protein
MDWLNVFKHLLPNARAWRITIDKTLKRFFQGLTGVGSETKTFLDTVYDTLDPQKTGSLSEWEQQFALRDSSLTEQQRRDRLEATWKALGGQNPRYLQDTLQAAGFDVYVHEWWEPIPGRPNGGSVNGDVAPVARNPNDYLDDGIGGTPFTMSDGNVDSQDNDSESQDGGTLVPVGYPLVNKIVTVTEIPNPNGDGAAQMQDGDAFAQDGSNSLVYGRVEYALPSDPATFPYFLYIGGQNFPNQANVQAARREEFEDLCLKICPTEQWLGILVNYS